MSFPCRSPATVDVGTYNIRIGAGLQNYGQSPFSLRNDVPLSVADVISVLQAADLDVVSLQEVFGDGDETTTSAQAEEIATALDMHYVYYPHGLELAGGYWGVALLSKRPLLNPQRVQISTGSGNTRAVALAETSILGKRTAVMSVHVDKDETGTGPMVTAVDALNAYGLPTLAMGDLNITLADSRHSVWTQTMNDAVLAAGTATSESVATTGTKVASTGQPDGRVLDYIYAHPDFLAVDAGIYRGNNETASDHYLVHAKLKAL